MEGLSGEGEGQHPDALLNADEVAECLGLDRATVWRWCKEGRIPCLKIGRLWRVRSEFLEALLKEAEGPGVPRPPK